MSSSSKLKNISSKPSENGNGYNPNLGKFHIVDTSAPSSVSPLRMHRRFSSIDETNDPYEPNGSGKEYDTVSNNSSWSADSEDHKDKPPQPIPSLQVDNEKREKIRLKNEKKHQRQKERRAQELHDRCIGFIVSRKLEALSQQLVAMGFSSERAKLALTMNQGKIEESILWLIEVGEGADKHKGKKLQVGNSNLDISEELARISAMEIRYKCSKQDVERAIVSSEGDLNKAEQLLSANHSSSTAQLKSTLSTSATRVPVEVERKSQPKLGSSPSILKISPQPKSQTQHLVPEKEINNCQLGKREPVILMQRPQSEVPQTRKVTGKSDNKRGNSEPISVVASLGLFSGSGSTSGSSGPSSPVDWNSVGSLLLQLDYKNVDWTLNPSPPGSKATEMWQGLGSVTARGGGLREWSSPFEERDMFTLPRQFVSPTL